MENIITYNWICAQPWEGYWMEKAEAGKIQRKSNKAVKEEPDKKSSAEWQQEEEYLNQTLDIVKRNVENYESEIREMSDQIEEMLQHYHDNDVEVPSLGFSTIFF